MNMIYQMKYCLLLLISAIFIGGCNLPSPGKGDPSAGLSETLSAAVMETRMSLQTTTAAEPTITSTALPTPTIKFTPTPTLTPTLTPTFGLTATPTLGPDYFHGTLRYDVGFVSQEGLKIGNKPVSTGCTPASVQMILDFWHAFKEEYPTMSAQQLININLSQNRFDASGGMNIMDTEDELRNMNYYLGTRTDSNKEELLTALERYGPILVLTKVNWTPFGANHMAVVTGYDPESDFIHIMDPWQTGGVMEFSYEGFDGIWGLNYLADEDDLLQRAFFFIVPFAELERDNEPFIPYYKLEEIHKRN